MGPPQISINPKAVLISFTGKTIELLKIAEGEKIAFSQDEESPRDWFLSKNENGFPLRVRDDSKKKIKSYSLNNNAIARKLLNSLGIEGSFRFTIGTEPININGVDYWPIITAAAKKNKP